MKVFLWFLRVVEDNLGDSWDKQLAVNATFWCVAQKTPSSLLFLCSSVTPVLVWPSWSLIGTSPMLGPARKKWKAAFMGVLQVSATEKSFPSFKNVFWTLALVLFIWHKVCGLRVYIISVSSPPFFCFYRCNVRSVISRLWFSCLHTSSLLQHKGMLGERGPSNLFEINDNSFIVMVSSSHQM